MIFQNKFRVGKALIFVAGLVFLVIIALQFPFLHSKITQVLYGGTQGDPRYTLFQCGWRLFSENFLFGVGICDVKEVALMCYGTFNDAEAIENKYNFHNAFLQIGVSTGIIGLVTFTALLAYLFVQALKLKRITHIGLIFLFTLGCITESLLTRNKGLIFFSTFTSLLFILRPYEKDPSR
jgi:O-antigen ligase